MELKGHTDGVRCARFFPSNSDRVVTNGSDGMVRFWDSRSDKQLLDDKTIAHRLDTVCVSLDGDPVGLPVCVLSSRALGSQKLIGSR